VTENAKEERFKAVAEEFRCAIEVALNEYDHAVGDGMDIYDRIVEPAWDDYLRKVKEIEGGP
jgi:hypothetical protein